MGDWEKIDLNFHVMRKTKDVPFLMGVPHKDSLLTVDSIHSQEYNIFLDIILFMFLSHRFPG